MDAGVLVINKDGEVVLTSPGVSEFFSEENRISQALIEKVQNGEIVSVQTKSGQLSDTPLLVVSYPFSEGHLAGILMCRPMPEIEASLKEMYEISIVSLFFISLLGLLVSYVTAKYAALPLMRMNRAAKVIANGNFEERVEVRGRDELGELAQSFNHMAESLQTHEKGQRDFIANISHDLRSPLTSMQGFLTAMLDGTIPPEKQERYLKIVLEETERLSRMTQSIVELSRAQSSAILLDETDFDLNELIRWNIEMLEPQAAIKGKREGNTFVSQRDTLLCAAASISAGKHKRAKIRKQAQAPSQREAFFMQSLHQKNRGIEKIISSAFFI